MGALYAGTSLPFLDMAACCLMAAAATTRARTLGAPFTGSMFLGALCGLIGPLLRENFLHGAPGSAWVLAHLSGWSFIGSAIGILLLASFARWQWRVFPILDALGIALATSLGTIMVLPEMGFAGALSLGLINGLAPGLLRDMSLGDTAMMVERDWYAAAAALGAMASAATFTCMIVARLNGWVGGHVDEAAVACGFTIIAAIILWKHPTAS